MPLVRIDFPSSTTPAYREGVGTLVYEAMTQTLNVPENDRFMVLADHAPGDLVIDPIYLGIARSPAAILIQITLNEGRAVALKQAFYKAVADGLQARVGLRPEDVFINLVEVKKENWSFGNGVAQYA